MFVIVSRFFLRKRFTGMAIWPFVFVRTAQLKRDTIFMNHERIHLRQQLEMLIVPFFIWYVIEFFIYWIHYKNRYDAYRSISFEKEAYENEKDLDYLKRRSFWKFVRYV